MVDGGFSSRGDRETEVAESEAKEKQRKAAYDLDHFDRHILVPETLFSIAPSSLSGASFANPVLLRGVGAPLQFHGKCSCPLVRALRGSTWRQQQVKTGIGAIADLNVTDAQSSAFGSPVTCCTAFF
ncbi:hypothetical protein TcWFU_009881 [Taenia crassiceps]|uniref:Uncharacterized protein n=1 Tax=Taenia crassiceps TaxID=6207 RepID=A0ABR4Q5Y6_9CEST